MTRGLRPYNCRRAAKMNKVSLLSNKPKAAALDPENFQSQTFDGTTLLALQRRLSTSSAPTRNSASHGCMCVRRRVWKLWRAISSFLPPTCYPSSRECESDGTGVDRLHAFGRASASPDLPITVEKLL
jgi:hypothetical protein